MTTPRTTPHTLPRSCGVWVLRGSTRRARAKSNPANPATPHEPHAGFAPRSRAKSQTPHTPHPYGMSYPAQRRSPESSMCTHAVMSIEIKANNFITNDPYAICGARLDPNGIDPFVAGTWELVCDECAEKRGSGDELMLFRALDEQTGWLQ